MLLVETLLFVSLLATEVIVGFLVLAYAAHSFLVVVQDTAAGSDEVVWPDEPFLDWVSRLFYLGWLVGIWLAPAALLLHLLEAPLGLLLPIAVLVLWLFVPIGLLSSLSAGSGWVVFRPALVARLVRRAGAALVFYGLTGLLLLGAAAFLGLSLMEGIGWLFLPVAAAGAAAGVLIHARLLGRLAWLLQQADAETVPPAEAIAPTAVPAASEAPPSLSAEAYGLLPEEPPPPSPHAGFNGNGHKKPDSQPAPEAESAGHAARMPWLASWPGAAKRPKRRPRYQPGQPPPRPFWTGVFSFPLYIDSLRAWLTLSFGMLVLGALAQLMIFCRPG